VSAHGEFPKLYLVAPVLGRFPHQGKWDVGDGGVDGALPESNIKHI